MSAMGLQMIARQDRLWDGYNTEISSTMTPVRRYGYSKYCTAAFGSSNFPLNCFSHKRGNRCQEERRKIGKHARQELEIESVNQLQYSSLGRPP
jgi:hypothetical protein